MTMPLLEGLDGTRKMSKSFGNYVGITEPAAEMFGKLMSISDGLLWRYMDLLSGRTPADIQRLRQAVQDGQNPMVIKLDFAEQVVARYHSAACAADARRTFTARFQRREAPEDVALVRLQAPGGLMICAAIQQASLAASNAEAIRLVQQGAVRVNGLRVDDPKRLLQPGCEHLVQVGKRRVSRILLI